MDREETLTNILTRPYELFPNQAEAVTSSKRFVRVTAGAGAGKTETLTRRIAYLLLYRGEPPSSIVAFTFTKRAAQSMKNRIYRRVSELAGEDACSNLGEMYIGTIHGYCLHLLQDYFGYGNYEELDENQEMAFLMRHGWGLGLHTFKGTYSDNCGTFARSVNLVYDELLDRNGVETTAPRFYCEFNKYEDILKEHRLLTFAQMIFLAVQGLTRDRSGIDSIIHLIVDEYQDINKAQEQLIEIIGKQASLFVVGDPRQCIYRWRGSDESYFQDFQKAHPEAHPVLIAENNRSCPEIVNAANSIAATFKGAKYSPLKEVRKDKGSAMLVSCATNVSEASWLIDQVDTLVNKYGVCNYSDIAVLLRSVATSAEPFIEACRNNSIPYLVGGKVGLFHRPEAQMLGRLYTWLSGDGFWRLNKYTRESIEGDDLLYTAANLYESITGLTEFPFEYVQAWKEQCINGDFPDFTGAYRAILVILGLHHLDPADKMNAAILANLGRFNALLTDYESSIRRGGARVDWQRVWQGLVWYINSYAMGAYEEQPAEDLRGVDALQIMTVHQAKGLEWPVVFIPCMTAKRFPSSRALSEQEPNWYVPTSLFDNERYAGGYEDEHKLFYVAVTRARDLCYLSYHKRIRINISGSPFLNDLGKGVISQQESEPMPKIVINKDVEQEEIQTFTGSEIIEYLRCPYFYRLRENWNYQAGLDVALGYGKSLHHCLRIASDKIKEGSDPISSITQAIDDEFHLPYANPRARKNMKEAAKKALTLFVEQHIEDMKNIEEVEARLEFPVENATVAGRVDVILHGRGTPSLEVRDYKTSEEVTTFQESSLQVQLYTLGLRKMGHRVEIASIAYLDTGDIKEVDVSDMQLKTAEQTAKNAIEGIMSFDYSIAPTSGCKCDYLKICYYHK